MKQKTNQRIVDKKVVSKKLAVLRSCSTMRFSQQTLSIATLLICIIQCKAQIDFQAHLAQVNGFRAAVGAAALRIDVRLNRCAQAHSQDMNDNTGLSHTGSDGSRPGERITRCTGESNIFAGENAASGFFDDNSVNIGFFNSPEHKANLLNPNYNCMGIGRVNGFWTQNFAKLSSIQGVANSPAPQQRSPSPNPVVRSPSPAPVIRSPSPNPPPAAVSPVIIRSPSSQPAIRTALITTATVSRPRATLTAAGVVNSTATSQEAFATLPPVPETGTLAPNEIGEAILIPKPIGAAEVAGNRNSTNAGDQTNGSDTTYEGGNPKIQQEVAIASINQLPSEDREPIMAALLQGEEFNPFFTMSYGSRMIPRANLWGLASFAVVCLGLVLH
ncbi:hypothetical protein HK098_007362 [Nowakowskiella sp. JEL0407]|nr:hypothetical protein HK098_007362 [Nowakowskiella sp. JEL0407]